tara:strand:- start:420 stop:890 length:471 start_codon:yes stop_codon:yes gene_type:complete
LNKRGRSILEFNLSGQGMPPFWPFKKKETVPLVREEPPAPVVYRRGEDPYARASVEADQAAYKEALALFGGGSQEVAVSTELSADYDGVVDASTPLAKPEKKNDGAASEASPASNADEGFTWVHHSDGYHYKRLASGAFEPTPHTKNGDGTYTPYS